MNVECELVECVYCVDHACQLSEIKIDEYGGCLSFFVVLNDNKLKQQQKKEH